MRHEAVAIRFLARVIEHQRRDEMELQIRRFQIGTAFQERAGFQTLPGREPCAEQQILQAGLRRIERIGLAVKRDRLAGFILDRTIQMVLQIAADAFQMLPPPECRSA